MTHYYTLFIVYLLPHNSQDQLGRELYEASDDGDMERVTRLLREGAPVNWKNRGRWTALHQACYYNRPEVVKVLLKYNPNINQQDDNGDTPLHGTCHVGSLGCVEVTAGN